MRKAFPDSPVRTMCLVMHPGKPDFELYYVDLSNIRADQIVLTLDKVRMSVSNSVTAFWSNAVLCNNHIGFGAGNAPGRESWQTN